MGSPNEMDWGGVTLVIDGLKVGATGPDQAGTERTGDQLAAAAATPSATSTTVAADVLAIPVTHQYVAKTSGADAEACTLADGTPGQFLTVELATDGGGDATMTPATSTGFVAVVFADAGDVVTLRYVDDTVGWILIGAFGATAQPAITQS
jgi:hypothetical protein